MMMSQSGFQRVPPSSDFLMSMGVAVAGLVSFAGAVVAGVALVAGVAGVGFACCASRTAKPSSAARDSVRARVLRMPGEGMLGRISSVLRKKRGTKNGMGG